MATYELTKKSCQSLEDMAMKVLSFAMQLGMTYEELAKLYDVMNTCVIVDDRDRHPPSIDAIEEYLEIVREEIVVGQADVVFIKSMSRSASVAHNAESDIAIQIPITDSERTMGKAPSYVIIQGSNATSGTVAVTIMESPARLYTEGMQFVGNPVQVHTRRHGSESVTDRIIRIVLRNLRSQEYGHFNLSAMNFTTVCVNGDYDWHNYSCPAGGRVSHKCSGYPARATTPCPPVAVFPCCRVILENEVLDSDDCSIVTYDIHSTTCDCILREHRRRRLTEDTPGDTYESSGGVEVVSMALYSYDEFVDTLFEIEDLSPRDLQKTILVICMFAVLWTVGLLALVDNINFTFSSKVITERVRLRSSVAGSISGGAQESELEAKKRYLSISTLSSLPSSERVTMD